MYNVFFNKHNIGIISNFDYDTMKELIFIQNQKSLLGELENTWKLTTIFKFNNLFRSKFTSWRFKQF